MNAWQLGTEKKPIEGTEAMTNTIPEAALDGADGNAAIGGAVATDGDGDATVKQEQGEGRRFTQSDLDRAISKALATREAALKAENEAALAEQQKKEREARLAEEGKYQELAKAKEKELTDLKAQIAAEKLRAETAGLLSERGIPELAEIFAQDLATVEGRAAAADAIREVIDSRTDASVRDRLRTPAIPKGKPAPVVESLTLAEQARKAEREGRFEDLEQINHRMMLELRGRLG